MQNECLCVLYLDSIAYDVQDYVWAYNTNVEYSKRRLTRHTEVFTRYKKQNNHFYKDNIAFPYQNPTDKILQRLKEEHKGRMPYSWFYFDLVKNASKDKIFILARFHLNL